MRYAAALLYDAEKSQIAGLTPCIFMTVASPNLGVRNFGVYRFLPQPLLARAHLICGTTGLDLVLEDERDENILVTMTRDNDQQQQQQQQHTKRISNVNNANRKHAPDDVHALQFVSALRVFPRRYLYANMRNDFMVNYGTAALDPSVQVLSANDIHEIVNAPHDIDVEHVDVDYDEKGCKVCFTFEYPPNENVHQQQDEQDSKNAQPENIPAEKLMADRLKAIGWTVVAVDFPLAMPIAVSFFYNCFVEMYTILLLHVLSLLTCAAKHTHAPFPMFCAMLHTHTRTLTA